MQLLLQPLFKIIIIIIKLFKNRYKHMFFDLGCSTAPQTKQLTTRKQCHAHKNQNFLIFLQPTVQP